MGNTVWSGVRAGGQAKKLYLTSGQFTGTLKDSIDTDTALGGGLDYPMGVSFDGINTPWAGAKGGAVSLSSWGLFLQSGLFTDVLKTSFGTASISPDRMPEAITWDGANTPWVGRGQLASDDEEHKLYLQSGQFTNLVKDSLASPEFTSTTPFYGQQLLGISTDGTDTFVSGLSSTTTTPQQKLMLRLSGIFSDTIKDSLPFQVGGIQNAHDLGWNGTDTLGATHEGSLASKTGKLWKQSGKFSSTIKTSIAVTAISDSPRGIETDDVAARGVDAAIATTVTPVLNSYRRRRN